MVHREYTLNLQPDCEGVRRLGSADAELLANRFVSNGAIFTLPGCPVSRFLVGHLAWLDPQRIFWFTAYGDSAKDGHLLEFDEARFADSTGIAFLKDGRVAGCLNQIAQSGVEDPDDYRIAWQLWQEVAPLRARLIAASYADAVGDGTATAATRDLVRPRDHDRLRR